MRKSFSIWLILIVLMLSSSVAIIGYYCGAADSFCNVTENLTFESGDAAGDKSERNGETRLEKEDTKYSPSNKSTVVAPVIIGFLQSFALYFTSEDDSFVEPKYKRHSPILITDFAAVFKSLF